MHNKQRTNIRTIRPSFSVVTLLILLSAFLQACNSEKNLHSLIYFNEQGDTALAKIVQNTEPIIQPGDRLSITVNALNAASAAPYNLGSAGVGAISSGAAGAGTIAAGTAAGGGYLVEADGTIQFPQLGKIKVAGMHRKELIDTLTAMLVKYVTDPIVTIQFLNFKITVLGEVNTPGTINIPEGKVTLIEALGLAGDLTYYSRRDNIIVIREQNGQREFGKISLLSKNSFSSPYFVLKQNDVIYIEPTKAKAAESNQTLTRNISITASVLSVLTTLVVLIINVTRN